MEEQVQRLVDRVWSKTEDLPRSKRYLVAVSGIPGSGKTTLAAKVADALNERWRAQTAARTPNSILATFLPMDGYHLTRAQLSALPDPDTAHARRGAAFTFDAPAFLALVKKLREPICPETGTIYAPSFDHAVKDPVADDIPIQRESRVLVMEGNYLSLGKGEWKEAAELMDELWFVEVDEDVARERLIKRHIKAGLAKDEEEAGKRADENDLVNGREIIDGRLEVHEIVKSREDDSWKPQQQGV
ncbi:Putative phosphoribulokinase/uridine kinase, P-loop containing nucleoside triphosphate hydrolase [Septoria linicola]|uniref:Phosphoribulokinase/uridine kinase, P-loop containing nucleoside triphosphate hydrolase n=1 Tax=Septoria linicola TaxID=215465 RepID=A0A9Q9B3Y7_9PEZI|nr:putative phosphoribulokinase/uridine kinase, P-loop containing nucleoside triphosphate hydrolase [Septoria linicola]USW58508.1 Putative phosphoribulokinase/uridine kinase, P-loop containing nucleoside triphosphate hydrolase [Septoria linicola]